jgi:hypothetical protein
VSEEVSVEPALLVFMEAVLVLRFPSSKKRETCAVEGDPAVIGTFVLDTVLAVGLTGLRTLIPLPLRWYVEELLFEADAQSMPAEGALFSVAEDGAPSLRQLLQIAGEDPARLSVLLIGLSKDSAFSLISVRKLVWSDGRASRDCLLLPGVVAAFPSSEDTLFGTRS